MKGAGDRGGAAEGPLSPVSGAAAPSRCDWLDVGAQSRVSGPRRGRPGVASAGGSLGCGSGAAPEEAAGGPRPDPGVRRREVPGDGAEADPGLRGWRGAVRSRRFPFLSDYFCAFCCRRTFV